MSVKRLLIVGAGGFGRELHAWCLQHPDCGRAWKIGGFLDERANALADFNYPVDVVGSISGYEVQSEDILLCALGLPKVKQEVCQRLLSKGAEFLTFVHPSVVMGQNVQLGRGVVLCPRVVLTCDIELNEFVMFNVAASAGHDVRVGSWSTVSGHCDLTGRCKVGERVFFGSHACVIPGREIGDGAVVGTGAVVVTNVKSGNTVYGNPARRLAGL